MKLKIEFTCDNAAFEGRVDIESARILRVLADKIEAYGIYPSVQYDLSDFNGNRVGTAKVIGK